MQTSILIARLLGPVLAVAGLAGLVKPEAVQELAREFLASRALIFITGVLTLVAGLAIVNAHNLWTAGWPVIITIFGWLAVLGGVARMAFPAAIKPIGEAMLANKTLLRVAHGAWLVLGAYLMFVGYL